MLKHNLSTKYLEHHALTDAVGPYYPMVYHELPSTPTLAFNVYLFIRKNKDRFGVDIRVFAKKNWLC